MNGFVRFKNQIQDSKKRKEKKTHSHTDAHLLFKITKKSLKMNE